MLTTFLASLWGPAVLALGIGFLASPRYYKRLYTDLDKESLSILTLSIFLIPLGIAQVMFHNTWTSFPEGLVSFLGWATMVKGFALAIMPRVADRTAEFEAKNGFLPFVGTFMVILGGYLTWFAFF